ncbi:hypothetical protein BGZ95_008744 [Linnemannia exigua]|uniref:Uncharacterized protein n=1 Tax=Linnemannia exigua TaxID=604196 RepID=A0AAD4DDU8_9FUNG|nr:hypothetical protein BGZ95_008744 [Linnemannia exigua]
MISADGIVPNPSANETTPLQYQPYPSHQNSGPDDYGKHEGEHHHDDDDHHHDHQDGDAGGEEVHDHAPGERCSLPPLIQPLVSHENHGMVESVVVKVRDSADVTQRTIFYFWDEWKLFVNRGNVIDLGIGVVLGGAFSDIIDSFVVDIMTPPLSLWATGTNLENSFIVLKHGRTAGKIYDTILEAQEDGAVREKIRPPPKVKECLWCREDIALDAFRCKFCQSFVKDIPGIEDAGVGMFVTIKRPSHKSRNSLGPVLDQNALAVGMAAGVIAAKDKEREKEKEKERSNYNSPPSSRSHSQSHSTGGSGTGTGTGTGTGAGKQNGHSTSTSTPAPHSHSGNNPTLGPSEGKKIAAGLSKVDGAK